MTTKQFFKMSLHCSERLNIFHRTTYFQGDIKKLCIFNNSLPRLKKLYVNIIPDIPFSQLVPVYPAALLHEYRLNALKHLTLC